MLEVSLLILTIFLQLIQDQLIIEEFNDKKHIRELIERLQNRETLVRVTELGSSQVWCDQWQKQTPILTDTHWQNIFGPT